VLLVGLLALFVVPQPGAALAQDSALVAQLLAGINATRVANGLPPFALNALLTQAAQAHSEYQRETGTVAHEGPGGNRPIDRVLATGYPASRANENLYAGWQITPEEALSWWLSSTPHRNNLLHPVLREIGIGIAGDPDGVLYFTLNFSAQPNVLPVFINDDATATGSADVTLTLWNEDVFGGGEGRIGQATQIMVSNTPDFAGAVTMPWAQYVDWTLDTSSGTGLKTVYVRFIDSAGRTADSQDSIVFDTGVGSAPQPTAIPTADVQPTPESPQPTTASQPTPAPQLTFPPTVTPEGIAGAEETPTPGLPIHSSLTSTPTLPAFGIAPTPAQTAIPIPERVFGVPVGRLRVILFGTLALGLGAIAAGGLALARSGGHRAESTEAEEESDPDGDD
jgi:hypothetical protein